MKLIFSFLLTVLNSLLFGQNVSITFNPIFNAVPLQSDKAYSYKTDSIQITALKFYLSDIQVFQDNKPAGIAIKKYHLVNVEDPASLSLNYFNKNNQPFNRVTFNIGIDSLTNVSGAQAGDLDPTNGMYWTWQSGYINVKLEGKSKMCTARNNEFIFHIGGYQYPNATIQPLSFNIPNKKNIAIDIDITQLLNQVNLAELYHLMSPGTKAVEMAQQFSAIFKACI
ncbi:MbnP family protein [Ferruginibacter profundus]